MQSMYMPVDLVSCQIVYARQPHETSCVWCWHYWPLKHCTAVVWRWLKHVYNSGVVGTQSPALSAVASTSLHFSASKPLCHSAVRRLSQDCTGRPPQGTRCPRRPAVHTVSTWSRWQTASSLEPRDCRDTEPAAHQVQRLLPVPREGDCANLLSLTDDGIWWYDIIDLYIFQLEIQQ